VSIGLILNFTLYYLNLIPSLPGFNHFSYDKVSSTVLMLWCLSCVSTSTFYLIT